MAVSIQPDRIIFVRHYYVRMWFFVRCSALWACAVLSYGYVYVAEAIFGI